MITVSTDGSALGNPNGPMGWAWADHTPRADGQMGHAHPGDCDAGGATNGTNQIGELCAVLEALRAHPGNEPLTVETDSQYAINCSTKWVHGWKKNGWVNSQKKPVKNAALIKAIDAELSHRAGTVRFVWVKGHAGNAGNEKVDELARTYAGDCRSGVRDGYLPLEGWQSLLASEYSRGTDVPADAQMLMDGAISAAEYHLGRGESSTASEAGRGTGRGNPADGAGRSEESTRVMRKPSLAELLAEPEGVPELATDRLKHTEQAGKTVTATGDFDTADATETAVLPIDRSTITDADSTDESDGRDDEAPDMTDFAGAVDATDDVDSSNDADGESDAMRGDSFDKTTVMRTGVADLQQTAPTAQTASTAQPVQTPQPTQAVQSVPSTQSVPPAQAAPPAQPTQAVASGLTVSGTLRFSPPPSSSPTFDGQPRLIRGYIPIEGYVAGDGTIILDNTPFSVRR